MDKKRVLVFIVFCILLLASCGSSGNTDVPAPQEEEPDTRYQELRDALASFDELQSGALDIDIDFSQKFIDVAGLEDSEYDTRILNTVSFQKSAGNYDFLQMIRPQDQELPYGFRQKDGVSTKYSYQAFSDGTFQWQEGPATLNQTTLPEEVQIFLDLPDLEMIDEIIVDSAAESNQYTLILKKDYFSAKEQDSQYNGYELQEYNLSYFLDQSGALAGASLSNKESWIHSDIYTVQQTHQYHLSLSQKNETVDLEYFETNGTYTRPEYTEITEIWREEYINIPESYIFDVRIPRVKENLPNADKINLKIETDCNMELYATQEDLTDQGGWGGYPWHTTDFAVYKFDDVYEICIFNSEASAWGSGVGMWIYTYFYDSAIEDEISAEDFLVKMGYTPEEVMEIFAVEYLGDISQSGMYTFEEVSNWYYFDEDGKLQFYVNLFG